MNRFATLSLLLCIPLISAAQYPYPDQEMAVQVLSKPLAVQLLIERTEVEKAYNQALREAFRENHSTDVQFFTPKDMARLRKNRNTQFVYLVQPEMLPEDIIMAFEYVDGTLQHLVQATCNDPDDVSRHELEAFSYEKIDFDYWEFLLIGFDGKKEDIISRFGFVNGELTKLDYVFLAQQIALLCKSSADGIMRANYVDEERNVEELMSKKTYFLKDYFDDEESKIDEQFDPVFELVGFDEYAQVILNKTKNATYLRLIYSYQHNQYMWLIVDAENGQILSINNIGDYKFAGSFTAAGLIKARRLDEACKVESQKLNNYYNR